MPDTLILGGISFDGFSTPPRMGAGGKQQRRNTMRDRA